MNCDEALPLLPLRVLDALELPSTDALAEHLADCPRCRGREAVLSRTLVRLDALPMPRARPTNVDALLAGAGARREPAPESAPTSWRRAAAGLLPAAFAAGLAGGWLGTNAHLTRPTDRPGELAPAERNRLVEACLALDDRLTALELRHQRELLTLARAIDAAQSARDDAISTQLTTLASLAGRELHHARAAVAELTTHVVAQTAEYRSPLAPARESEH